MGSKNGYTLQQKNARKAFLSKKLREQKMKRPINFSTYPAYLRPPKRQKMLMHQQAVSQGNSSQNVSLVDFGGGS